MAELGNLVVKMLADINDLKKKMDGYGKKIDEAKKTTQKFSSSIKDSFKKLVLFGGGIAGAIIAIRKLTQFMGGNLDAWTKQEDAVTELNSALETTGIYTPQVSENLQQLASDLQLATRYGDEETLSAVAMLQSLAKLDSEGLQNIIPAVQDLAAGMKIDLKTAASLVGKTLGSTTNALSRYGIVLDMSGTKVEKLVELQEQINEKFGGRAAELADNYGGKIIRMKNAYGDLREVMGKVMADKMDPMLPMITDLINRTKDWIEQKYELKKAYELLKKPMGEVNDLTRLELLQAQQLVAIDELNNLEKQLEFETSTSIVGSLKDELGGIDELIAAKRKEIRARAQLIDNMTGVIKLREKENQQTEEGIEISEEEKKWREYLAEAEKAYEESIHFSGQALEDYNEMLESRWASEKWLKESGDKLIESGINLTNVLSMEERTIAGFNSTLDTHQLKIDRIKSKYDEWASKTQETVNNISEYTSMAFDSIDNVVDQSFRNREQKLENWYEEEKDKIYANIEDEEERESALEDLEHQYDQKSRELSRSQAIADKNMAILKAIMNTAQAVTKALTAGPFIGPVLAGIIGALGAAQIALIKKQPIPALAEGGEIVTNGPTLVMAGDNPGGVELLQATPLSSPNINGPKMAIVGPLVLEIDSTPIYKGMLKATEDGFALIDENAIVRQ